MGLQIHEAALQRLPESDRLALLASLKERQRLLEAAGGGYVANNPRYPDLDTVQALIALLEAAPCSTC
jgi:hypothetical protein